MATTKDWSSIASYPSASRYFAGGDATDWCLHTPPPWARVVSVYNRGATALYVSFGPADTGTAAVTDDCIEIAADSGRTVPMSPQGEAASPGSFSTWGLDGATHAMDLQFDRTVG